MSPCTSGIPALITLRHDLRPGDLGAVVQLHGTLYDQEYGFDITFEAYVAGPLAEFVLHPSPRNRLWLAEDHGKLVGCIAIVEVSAEEAQLRWYLVDAAVRGQGLGKRLIAEAVRFCRTAGYRKIFLWTVGQLTSAAHVYQSFGFQRVETKASRLWGVEVIEERYELEL
jgi:GNAT superfamily N-acetyltransferase